MEPLITAGFDAGNGELIDSTVDAEAGLFEARLNMGKEPFTEGTDKREHWQCDPCLPPLPPAAAPASVPLLLRLPRVAAAPTDATRARWFYFRASNIAAIKTCRFRIMNAGSSSYPAAWPGTWAVASYGDRTRWFRVPTTYDEETGELCVTVRCPSLPAQLPTAQLTVASGLAGPDRRYGALRLRRLLRPFLLRTAPRPDRRLRCSALTHR